MLARTLGMTLTEMGERMSSAEFALHWQDYQRFPWGPERWDLGFAMICATMANIAPNRRKGAPPAKLKDFLLFERQPQGHEPTAEEIDEFFKGK